MCYCLTPDWTNGLRSPAKTKDFFSIVCVQTSSEIHLDPYPVGSGRSFPEDKARPGRDADHDEDKTK
jgi:hypothetical protein